MIALEPHLPVLQVAVPMLLAPLVVLLHPRGLAWAAALSMLGLFIVGVVKTRVTRTAPIKAGLENLVIAGIGGVLAYGIGSLFDGVISG